jgi:Fur family ferric uptake transcriptional regulator
MVIRHNFEGGVSVFELDEGEHHDHLICTQCQKVMEFQCEAIERLQEEMAAAKGFHISNHCLNIYGLCSACQDD